MITSNLPYQMSITQAAALMRANLESRPQEERDYIVNHFLEHLRDTGITPSETFIQAFELATAPFKKEV